MPLEPNANFIVCIANTYYYGTDGLVNGAENMGQILALENTTKWIVPISFREKFFPQLLIQKMRNVSVLHATK
jgi:hypothetical protein